MIRGRSPKRLAASGAYTDAADALDEALLDRVSARVPLRLDPSKTAGDYARDLRRTAPTVFGPFREFARGYEVVIYRLGSCDQPRFQLLLELAGRIDPSSGRSATRYGEVTRRTAPLAEDHAVIAAALIAAILLEPTPSATPLMVCGALSSDLASPGGARGLYEIAGRLGWPESRRRGAFAAPLDSDRVYLLLDPPVSPTIR